VCPAVPDAASPWQGASQSAYAGVEGPPQLPTPGAVAASQGSSATAAAVPGRILRPPRPPGHAVSVSSDIAPRGHSGDAAAAVATDGSASRMPPPPPPPLHQQGHQQQEQHQHHASHRLPPRQAPLPGVATAHEACAVVKNSVGGAGSSAVPPRPPQLHQHDLRLAQDPLHGDVTWRREFRGTNTPVRCARVV
jgi:hypothetical protein